MSNRLLRVAVVGCGRVSRTAHYASIKENPAYEFVAVCDTDRSRADEWSRSNNVKAYYSIDDLLANEKLDMVSICTPNGMHPQHAGKVAEKGIHLMVEKPLAMSTPEADQLIQLCAEKGVRLFSVMQNRFNATNQLLKRAVDKGRFGRLLTVNVTMRWARGLGYYTEDHGWRGRRDMAGGVFTNQAIHYIDTMQWLIGGSPTTAYARMDTSKHPIDVETHGSGIITFDNGTIASLNLTALSYPDDREGSITLLGERGTVKLGGKAMNRILEWDFDTADTEDDAQAKEADYEPPTVYGFGHFEMYKRAARVLQTGEGVAEIPDGLEGRKAVALLEALYTSNSRGDVVKIQNWK